MDKEIIENFGLYLDNDYMFSDATLLYGINTYKFKDIDHINISQFDRYSDKDLRIDNTFLVVANYKNAFNKQLVTKEFLIQCDKVIIMEHFKELVKETYNYYIDNK